MAEEKQKADMPEEIKKDKDVIASIGTIFLTDKYVYQTSETFGNEFYKCIFLKDVSSLEFGYKSYPGLLLAAVLLLCYSFIDNAAVCISMAVILVIAFFMMRKNSIIISAHNKETISQPLLGKKEDAKIFLNKLIETKKNFIK